MRSERDDGANERKSVYSRVSARSRKSRLSRKSKASGKSKVSRKSRLSRKSKVSRKSRRSQQSNKRMLESAVAHFDIEEIAAKIRRLEEKQAQCQLEFKKLLFEPKSNADDLLYKDKINYFSKELASMTKELLEMRKLQRKILNANLKLDDF